MPFSAENINIRRFFRRNKGVDIFMKMKSVMTGIGIGMAVGGAAGLVTGAMSNPSAKKMYKKKATKALKAMENMFDDMQNMFK